MKKILYLFASLIFLALPFLANADPENGLGCDGNGGYGYYGRGGMMGTGGDFMLGYGWVIPFIFWLLIIAAITVFAVHFLKNQRHQNFSMKESAADILNKRFVKGEIDKEKFDQMKRELIG